MSKVWKMPLSYCMKQMNVSGLVSGLGIVLFTTIPPGGLITVLVVRYTVMSLLNLKESNS